MRISNQSYRSEPKFRWHDDVYHELHCVCNCNNCAADMQRDRAGAGIVFRIIRLPGNVLRFLIYWRLSVIGILSSSNFSSGSGRFLRYECSKTGPPAVIADIKSLKRILHFAFGNCMFIRRVINIPFALLFEFASFLLFLIVGQTVPITSEC